MKVDIHIFESGYELSEHPFNLKGGAIVFLFVFLENIFLFVNLMGKKILSQTWAEKILKALMPSIKDVFVEKSRIKYFVSEKNHSPPPFKLNR